MTDARAAIVSLVVLGAIGVLWDAIKGYGASAHVAVPVVIAGAVVVTASALVIWNEWNRASERERQLLERQQVPSNDEIAERLRSWLLELGYQIMNQVDPNSYFNILATNAEGLKCNVFRLREGPYRGSYVVVATNAQIIDDNPTAMKALTSAGSLFRVDTALALAQLGVDFAIPPGGNSIKIDLQRPIVFDETVTRLAFSRELQLIHRAVLVVHSTAARTVLEHKRLNP